MGDGPEWYRGQVDLSSLLRFSLVKDANKEATCNPQTEGIWWLKRKNLSISRIENQRRWVDMTFTVPIAFLLVLFEEDAILTMVTSLQEATPGVGYGTRKA